MADTSRSRARGALPEPAFCPILSPFISDLHHQSIRLVTESFRVYRVKDRDAYPLL